jgi:ATP-dependent DNA helicase RecG
VRQALAICEPPAEIIPTEIRQEYGILPAERAYFAIHEPTSMQEAELAKKRLIFEEFFVFSAGLSLVRAARAAKKCPAYRNCDLFSFYNALPFRLTNAQSRAIADIAAAVCSDLIKSGAPCRGERVAKYNRLSEIFS